ncbi:MAG: hypothetical protein RL695_2461, partial [Pseudomonadota bacterium]
MKTRAYGFSLVELLVSILIGMVAMVFVMRSNVDFEKNRRSGIGGSDAMQNGVIALFSMENDAAQAGWGLNDPMLMGCPGRFFDTQNYANGNASLGVAFNYAPVTVAFNGANPDQIQFISGNSEAGTGSVGLAGAAVTAGATVLSTDSSPTYAYRAGDVLLLAPNIATSGAGAGIQPGPCAIAQVAATPVGNSLSVVNDGTLNSRFNRPAGLLTGFSGSSQTRIYNLGQGNALSFHTWDVSNGVLRLRATDLGGASQTPVSAVSGIVSIKALYGFDTRPAAPGAVVCQILNYQPDCGVRVTQWSAGMIDADASGVIDSLDVQRLVAVRLAVVARSRQVDKPAAGAVSCTASIPANAALPTVFSTQEPAGIATVPIQVNVAVAGDT